MNERQNRQQIHKAIGSTLSGLKGDPFLHTRVAVMAARDEKGEKKMRLLRNALILVCIALLGLGAIGLAEGLFSGSSDWDGNITPEEALEPTPAPSAEELEQAQREKEFQAENAPGEGEMTVYITGSNDFSVNHLLVTTYEEEEFRAWLEGTEMILPAAAPAGYVFCYGTVQYACKPGAEYQLVGYADSGEGYAAATYTLAEEDRVAVGYTILYKEANPADPENPREVVVWADALPSGENSEMTVRNPQSVRPVTVPGMEKALCVVDENGTTLGMYSSLSEPLMYTYFNMGDVELNPMRWMNVMNDMYYTVHGRVEEGLLLEMFGGE